MAKGQKLMLRTRLESHFATSKVAAGRIGTPALRGKWSIFATAAGSALAMATSSAASIIYSGPENITASEAGPASGSSVKNLSIDGANFRLLAHYGMSNRNIGLLRLSALSNASVGHNNSGGIQRLSSGQKISVGGPPWASQGRLRSVFKNGHGWSGSGGTFASGQTDFAGFRIKAGAGPFDFDYGWIRLVVHDNGNGYPASVTAIDWAYNDSLGQSINAGEGAPSTPEPGTLSLALLAGGAAGVMAWRRRRAQV